MQFYPADWLQDTQILTAASKAAWIDLICQLWISPTPGSLKWNRLSFTTYLRLQYDEEIELVVAELSRVADVSLLDSDENSVNKFENCTWIVITSRRIVRDWERLNKRKETYKKYNDKRTTKKPQKNHRQKSEVIYQKSEVRDQSIKNHKNDSPRPELTVEELVSSWNEGFTGKLPQVEWPLSASRHRKALQRLREHKSFDFWQHVFDNIAASQFLLGSGGNGNGRCWRCTFDFLINNDTNCIKIFEGAYAKGNS